MVAGSCRAGPAARSEQARRTLCGRPERIRKLGERLCLVSARDKKFARHSPTPGSVGVRTDLHPVDAGTDHQGETRSLSVRPSWPSRIRWEPDSQIQQIISGWPQVLQAPRAEALGFASDTAIDEVIQVFIEDDLAMQKHLVSRTTHRRSGGWRCDCHPRC